MHYCFPALHHNSFAFNKVYWCTLYWFATKIKRYIFLHHLYFLSSIVLLFIIIIIKNEKIIVTLHVKKRYRGT